MKEAKIINSRDEQGRSQRQTDDYPTTCASSASAEESAVLGQEERNAIISLLKTCSDSLTIYRFTLDKRIQRNRMGKAESDHFDRDERMIKLREDSLYVSNLLEDLIDEVEARGSWNVLVREIENNRARRNSENAVARDYEAVGRKILELRERVEDETNSNARETEELEAKLVLAKNEKERAQIKVGIESRYVTAWEKARCDGSSLRFNVALERLEYTLENLSTREKNEYRVATEIEAFLEQNVTANERAASQWQKRYDSEMLMYESDNRRLRSEIESRMEALAKLQTEYRERQEFIDTYVAEKEAAMERKKLEEHRHGCAIRIQAWWRGVMVRRKLGPYRPDEKKKKRPGKSKK